MRDASLVSRWSFLAQLYKKRKDGLVLDHNLANSEVAYVGGCRVGSQEL